MGKAIVTQSRCCLVQLLAVLCFGYVLEPVLTRVYMRNALLAAEKLLASLR
jgi:hypothetical protein